MSNVIVFLWTSLIALVAALILCVWAMRKASGSYRILFLFLFDIIVLMINIGIIGFAIGCLSNMR